MHVLVSGTVQARYDKGVDKFLRVGGGANCGWGFTCDTTSGGRGGL